MLFIVGDVLHAIYMLCIFVGRDYINGSNTKTDITIGKRQIYFMCCYGTGYAHIEVHISYYNLTSSFVKIIIPSEFQNF